MIKNNYVSIKEFETIGNDERGITSSFSLPRQQDNFIYITRKAGSISGNTYHQGKSPGTNPKVFILISGEIILNYRHIDEVEKSSLHLKAPLLIEIQPKVAHSIETITDIIIFECNSIVDIQNDRIKEQVCINKT